MQVLGFREKIVTPQKQGSTQCGYVLGDIVLLCHCHPAGKGLDGMSGPTMSPVPILMLFPHPKSP